MATTETSKGMTLMWPFHITCVQLSTIDPGDPLDTAHGGPSGAACAFVTSETTTKATSGDPVFINHVRASDSTTNDTVRIVPDTVAGGDLSGAVVRVYFWFVESASGGNRASA